MEATKKQILLQNEEGISNCQICPKMDKPTWQKREYFITLSGQAKST